MAGRRDAGPLLPVLVVIALLGAGLLAAAFGNPSIAALPRQLVPTTGAPTPQASIVETVVATSMPEERTSAPPSRAPTAAVAVLAGVLALIAAVFLAWWVRRDRSSAIQVTGMVQPVAHDQVRRLMWGAVDRGLVALAETDADPRGAVIACWARLEAVAAGQGVTRRPGDTSSDLVIRLLDAHQINADVLADFAAVYRLARFATHGVDEAMRARAQAALRQLRDEMAAEVVGSREARGASRSEAQTRARGASASEPRSREQTSHSREPRRR